MTQNTRTRFVRGLALVLAGGLFLFACGDDDSSDGDTASDADSTVEETDSSSDDATDDEGTIDHPVKKGEKGPERVPAVTRFVRRGVSPHARCSLVEAMPKTGRLHQIRRHFKHISHPLIGDVRYGKGDINRTYRSAWNLHRLALHAWRIRLTHPMTAEWLEIVAPMPADLAGPLEALGLSCEATP